MQLFLKLNPFGSPMIGRDFSSGNYRFGFNGKENDNEVQGQGNWQDYGMRAYSTRLGRFPTPDPLFAKYPMLSTYQFASNTPIMAIDQDGKEAYIVTTTQFHNSSGQLVQNDSKMLIGGEDYPIKPGTEKQAIIRIQTDYGTDAKVEEHVVSSLQVTIKASDYKEDGSKKSLTDKLYEKAENIAQSHPVCGADGMEKVAGGIEKVGGAIEDVGAATKCAPLLLAGAAISGVGAGMKIWSQTAQAINKKDDKQANKAALNTATELTKIGLGVAVDNLPTNKATKDQVKNLTNKAVDKVNEEIQK